MTNITVSLPDDLARQTNLLCPPCGKCMPTLIVTLIQCHVVQQVRLSHT